jgi:hypothetical protein
VTDVLTLRIEAAANDLQALAHDITRAVDVLPANTAAATRELLQQHARRALAIAAALVVEQRDPDPGVSSLLLRARRSVGVAVVLALGTVGVGALEQAGGDAWEALASRASEIARPADQVRRLTEGERRAVRVELGQQLRRYRTSNSETLKGLAAEVGSSQTALGELERSGHLPSLVVLLRLQAQVRDQEVDRLLRILIQDDLGLDVPV